eukprot:12371111-Karenia_brevis.AAC.1
MSTTLAAEATSGHSGSGGSKASNYVLKRHVDQLLAENGALCTVFEKSIAANRDLCIAIDTLQKRVQESADQILEWAAWVSSACFDAVPWVTQDCMLDSMKNNT